MKQFYIIMLLCLVSFSTIAQPYQSMFSNGDEKTYWVFKWSNLFGVINDTAYIDGEVNWNGVIYKKIMLASSRAWNQYPGGLLREDINTGKVWYRGISPRFGVPDDTLERLAFNFDLQSGDTFDISNTKLQPGMYPDTFNIVDSVRYISGLKHIYFKGIDASCGEPYTIIEGVGSHMGILWKDYFGTERMNQYLLCSYKNGMKTAYINKAHNGACKAGGGMNVADISEETIEITLHPQPANDKLYLKTDNNIEVVHYIVYNIHGQQISTKKSFSIKEIELTNIPSGIYYLKLTTNHGRSTLKSFIR